MNQPIKTAMGWREWAMLMTLSLLWGGSFFFVEVAITQLPPLTIVLSRVALAAIVLWIVALAMGIKPPARAADWISFAIMGLINNVIPFTLLAWGQIHIASGLAAILNATTPIFTVLVAGMLLDDERMTTGKLIGIGTGFCGVVDMIGPQALAGLGSTVVAQIAVLGAALSYAFAGVYGRRFKRLCMPPIMAATGQVTASALLLAPVALLLESPQTLALPNPPVLAALVALGLFSTALAYILYFRILASAGATNLLLVTFLIPASAILLGNIVLGEVLLPIHMLGMALIGCGLIAIDGRLAPYRRVQRRVD